MIPHPQKESTQFITWRLQVKSQLISYRFRQEIWKNKINNLRGGRRGGGGIKRNSHCLQKLGNNVTLLRYKFQQIARLHSE